MSDNIIIRKVEPKDIQSVVDIQVNGWKTAYKGIISDDFLESMNKEEKINKRKKDYNKTGFIVAELKNEIVGFCRYIDNNTYSKDLDYIDCEILALYVKVDLKYRGIGTKLFEYVKHEFQTKNKSKMILWCLKENDPSKKFYKKMGGKIVEEKEIELKGKKYREVGFLYSIWEEKD